jgi:hypothetical protein
MVTSSYSRAWRAWPGFATNLGHIGAALDGEVPAKQKYHMDLFTFRTLTAAPDDLSPALQSLWHDLQGHWDRAHEAVQDDEGTDAAWVHAYLHRKEGDLGNAAYWYQRAGKSVHGGSLQAEWEEIVKELLSEK